MGSGYTKLGLIMRNILSTTSAIKVPLKGELQGIGIGDNTKQLLYITQGTQYGWNAEWVSYRYFNTMPSNQWNVYEIPIGADWYARYGYYPEINKIHFVNDNDGCNGVVLFDAISITTRGGEVYIDDVRFIEKEYISSVSDKIYYYHNDHLGTPQVLTDEHGEISWYADYEPFGKVNIVIERTKNNFRFPGQYYIEETGLYYNWWRWYRSEVGRYVEYDPQETTILRFIYYLSEHYLYARNNPCFYSDIYGQQPVYKNLCPLLLVSSYLRIKDKKNDKYKHCYLGCAISRYCGIDLCYAASYMKEWSDRYLGTGTPDEEDIRATNCGCTCGFRLMTCEKCCICVCNYSNK